MSPEGGYLQFREKKPSIFDIKIDMHMLYTYKDADAKFGANYF